MMRVFAVAATDTADVLDLIVVDDETGEIAFGIGAAEQLFDELAPLDTVDMNVDEVIEAINGWSNGLLDIDEVDADETGDQVASLTGLARDLFNKKHPRKGGMFAPKGTADMPAGPSAAEVKAKAQGDSGGIEHVAHNAPAPQGAAPDEAKRRAAAQAEMDRLMQVAKAHPGAAKQAAKHKLSGPLTEAPPPGAPSHRAERGAVAKAIATGQPDALAGFNKRQLRAEITKRGLVAGSNATEDDMRALLLDNAGVQVPHAPKHKTVKAAIAAGDEAAVHGFPKRSLVAEYKRRGLIGDPAGMDPQDLANALLDSEPTKGKTPEEMAKHLLGLPKTAEGEQQARDAIASMKLDELKRLRKAMGTKVPPGGTTKKKIADDIVEGAVGYDRQTQALRDIAAESFQTPKVKPVEHPETLETRQLQVHARALGIDVGEIGHNRDELIKRINAVKEANKAPHTSKVNAHSLQTGDHIVVDDEVYRIVSHRQDMQGGDRIMVFDTVDRDGRKKRIVKPLNEPVPRVTGSRGGGSGTFSLEPSALDLTAWMTQMGLSGGELDDFNHKHPRGFGGKFGHSMLLFETLRAKAAKAGERNSDSDITFSGAGSPDIPDGQDYERSFDWSVREPDSTVAGGQMHIMDIRGPSIVDQQEDDQGNEIDTFEEAVTRIHLSNGDMRNLASMIGTALARREMNRNPSNIDDPKMPYLIALMDMQPTHWQPEDASYDEALSLISKGPAGGWYLGVNDDDGDSVNFEMSDDELDALYGQLASYLLTPREALPATPPPSGQAAAALFQAEQLDYAEAFAQWAANEFDISTMPEHLQRYWTEGEGAAKVRWGVRGAFKRARRLLLKEGVPLRMVNGTVANLYRRATGRYPGRHNRHGHTGPGRMAAMGTRIMLPMQTACAMCGNDQMMVDLGDTMNDAMNDPSGAVMGDDPDMEGPGDEMPDLDAPSASMGWRGPLAPIDVKTGDRRQFAQQALATRKLPLPFRWQEEQKPGHDGAVVVGALTGYSVADDGTIMGEGYFLDPAKIPQAERAMYLVQHGLIGPSVDLEPDMDVSFTDDTGTTFDPQTCSMDGSCPAKPTAVITAATVAGATLVPITAFAEARAPELFPRTVRDDMMAMGSMRPTCGCNQTASVRANGWDDLPFAGREAAWDKNAAVGRLVDWATGDSDTIDLDKYGQAFLWRDDVNQEQLTQGSFKLPIADIVDGELTIVPRAVFAVAARLNQTDIPASAKQDVRDVLDDLYGQMSDEFGDDTLEPPWDANNSDSSSSNEMSLQDEDGCGCAEKWARALTPPAGSQVASSVFAGMDPYPADAFRMKATAFTDMTIEERPGENFARIYGHIGAWSSCNRGHRGVCVPPPRSRSGYKEFHLGKIRTTEGIMPAGKIVMGEGHADVNGTPRVVRAFYDATSKEVAYGRMIDDEFGPFFSGVLAPGVTAQQATQLLMSPPSGHWTNYELMAVLAVNVPGHAVPVTPRAHMIGGEMVNMVAAGRWFEDDFTDVAAQLEALAWEAEAEQLAAALQ